jgi:hypothetical protein
MQSYGIFFLFQIKKPFFMVSTGKKLGIWEKKYEGYVSLRG